MTDQTDNSINTHAPSVIQIESSRLLPWIAVCAILGALALGISVASVIADSQVESAREQTINDIRNRAIDAETQALILRNHVDDLRQELAAHGIKPPAYPINLKGAK